MKIISAKPLYANWTKKFTCVKCKSKLEVTKDDLFIRNDAVFYAGETWEPNFYFVCPVCNVANRVTNQVPVDILSSKSSAIDDTSSE